MSWYCDDCDMDFWSWTGLKEHYVQSPYHFYCQICNDHFSDDYDYRDHLDQEHFACLRCMKPFRNEYGLQEHFRQSPAHHYCLPCKRDFQNDNNLRAHLNSRIHRPQDVKCPYRGCTQTFVSQSAMILHLESGSCISGVTRHTVNERVRLIDTNNYITDPSRMITSGDSRTSYIANSRSWNGYMYECYLCSAGFRSLSALNQHLASPKHQDKIYVCRLSTCQQRFTTLSALWQHVESEKCGIAKFKVVKDALDGITSGMKRLAF